MQKRAKEVALVGFLTAMIVVTGILKIPGVVPGTEFQLSAPVAIAIAAAFGFRRYLIAGVLASIVSLAFGLQTFLNVIVAMTFRVAGGGLILLLGNVFWVVILAGPVGTFCARLVLAAVTHTNVWVLVAAAGIGMLYTAVAAYPLYRAMAYLGKVSGFSECLVPKRNTLLRLVRRKKETDQEKEKETVTHDTI